MMKPSACILCVLCSGVAADLDVMKVQLQRARVVSAFCEDTGGGSMGALPPNLHLS